MNIPSEHPEELLSAVYDGEATAEERAAVEQWLATSPEAQTTLDEFSELSAQLRALPRLKAPRELAAGVRRRVATAAPVPASTPVRPQRRSRMQWAGGLAASAAMLLIAWGANHRFVPTAVSPATMAKVWDAPSTPSERFPPPGATDRTAVNSQGPKSLKLPIGSRINVSDRFSYLDRHDDQTVIVTVEVVDIDRSAYDMMVLLRQRGMEVLGEEPSSASHGVASSAGRLVAVYLEADDANLAKVVEQLAHDSTVQGVENLDQAEGDLEARLREVAVIPPSPRSALADHAEPRRAIGAPRSPFADRPPSPTFAANPAQGQASHASVRIEPDSDVLPEGVHGFRVTLTADELKELEPLEEAEAPAQDSAARAAVAAPAARGAAPLSADHSDVERSRVAPCRVLVILHSRSEQPSVSD